MSDFLSVFKTRRRYVNYGRLLADGILQHVGSERSDPIREMHLLMFFCFFAFSNLRRVHGFWPSLGGTNYPRRRCVKFFLMSGFLTRFQYSVKVREAEPSRVDRHRPAGLIHPNTRSPASGGLYWYLGAKRNKREATTSGRKGWGLVGFSRVLVLSSTCMGVRSAPPLNS